MYVHICTLYTHKRKGDLTIQKSLMSYGTKKNTETVSKNHYLVHLEDLPFPNLLTFGANFSTTSMFCRPMHAQLFTAPATAQINNGYTEANVGNIEREITTYRVNTYNTATGYKR